MKIKEVVIISAERTPIGSFNGRLSQVSATELGAVVIKEAIARAGILSGDVDEVIMGNVLSATLGQNPARQAAMKAGIPQEIPAWTVSKVCGSGLKAVVCAPTRNETKGCTTWLSHIVHWRRAGYSHDR